MLTMRRKTPPTETPLIIMKGISDFSSSKLLAKVSLASGGGAPEMGKLLVTQKTHRKYFFQPVFWHNNTGDRDYKWIELRRLWR